MYPPGAAGRHFRHARVGHHATGALLSDPREKCRSGAINANRKASGLQHQLQGVANRGVVVDDERPESGKFAAGRAVPPAVGKEIQPEAIQEMAEFLTGPCSCEIKEQNPGFDLLLTANWSSLAGYQEVLIPDPPPLVSMSQFFVLACSGTTP